MSRLEIIQKIKEIEVKIKEIGKEPIRVLDLFSGCGGLSTGFHKAGFQVIASIDIWKPATETLKKNYCHPVLTKDLTSFPPEQLEINKDEVDVIIGGPPCQGFSIAGRRDPKDPRNSLFMEYVKYLNFFQPKAFLMENVSGILSMKNQNGEKVINIILTELRRNYHCQYFKLLASKFGVPQNRWRIIFIGFRKDLNVKITPIKGFSNPIPVGSVLQPKKEISKEHFLSERAIEGIKRRKEKMKAKEFGFGAQFLDLNKPSFTIPARYWKDGYDALVKYNEKEIRKLTITELKRIQTFDEDYQFCNSSSKKEIIVQLGNAVPVKFAYYLALYLLEKLRNFNK